MIFSLRPFWRLLLVAVILPFTAWWHAAHAAGTDNLFETVESLTSARLVEAVLARNPDIPAMKAAWEASRARIEPAESFDDPILNYAVAPRTATADRLDFGQKINLSQRLPWPGKLELRGDVARFEADAAKHAVDRARLAVVDAAKSAFADWYYVHAATRINDVNKTLLQEFQNIAEVKYAAGRASKQDALRAQVEYTLLEHRDIVLERRRREAMAVLNALLQRRPDAALPPPATLEPAIAPPPAAELRRAAIEARPDLRALSARIEAARRRIALAERDYYPDFKVTAEYNSLWDREEKQFTVGAGVNIPLQGKRRAIEAEARSRLMSLELEHQGKVTEVESTVQRAHDRLQESIHVLSLYGDRLLPLSEENLAAARSDYEAGRGNFLDLISAERNLMKTRLLVERARADHHRRGAALEHAVGGSRAYQNTKQGSIRP